MKVFAVEIGHNRQPGHNKLYYAEIVPRDGGVYDVIGRWGKLGGKLRSKVYHSGVSNLAAAERLRTELLVKKLDRGYEDVRSSFYKGPVFATMVEISDGGAGPVASTEVPVSELEPEDLFDASDERQHQGSVEMVCIDNLGLQDKFELGASYKTHSHPSEGFLWVEDMNGERRECFVNRFAEPGVTP